jgi:hypothetical protein
MHYDLRQQQEAAKANRHAKGDLMNELVRQHRSESLLGSRTVLSVKDKLANLDVSKAAALSVVSQLCHRRHHVPIQFNREQVVL